MKKVQVVGGEKKNLKNKHFKNKCFLKRFAALLFVMVMLFSLAACGSEKEKNSESNTEKNTAGESTTEAKSEANTGNSGNTDDTVIRVGSLKGPTTMGLVNLMKASENGEASGKYTFTMETQADVIASGIVGGTLDVALVPANLAAVLYKKTEGKVKVLAINTRGVLECVTGDASIKSVKDLAGKTVLSTGQGTTPEYATRFLLEKYGVTDCTIEFKSEATEIASVLKEDPTKIAILPQPFATVAQVQNEAVKSAFTLTEAWAELGVDSQLITGLTIVRSDFLAEHPAAVANFLKEASASAEKAVSDVDGTAELIASYGIIEKAPIAKKALPSCNIVCITGSEMKGIVSGYLKTLFDQDPKAVGGAMPGEDFYYLGE